ncbi:MAG: metallophosphoesterase, partial [Methylocystis sp.]
LDVTRAEDRAVDWALAPFFKQQFAALADIKGPLWIAMHKPIYGSIRVKDGVSIGDNKTLVEAARGVLAPNLETMLSGHLHLFEALSFTQDLPAQIVAGSSGDKLDTMPQKLVGLTVGDATVESGRGAAGVYGFALLERGEKEWRLTEFDLHDQVLVRCALRGRKLACEGE